jgi:hypothetical protein
MNDLDPVRAGLRVIDQQIAAGRWGCARPWGGAGVVVTRHPVAPDRPGDFYHRPRAIVTPHTASLSWLLEQLWAIFRPAMDAVTKFEFFGRLANAAVRYQAHVDGNPTERDLLGAVVHEAHSILVDMESGTFTAPSVTFGGATHDDQIPDHERPRYITIEEANSWLTDSPER